MLIVRQLLRVEYTYGNTGGNSTAVVAAELAG